MATVATELKSIPNPPPAIYPALVAVGAELAKVGIAKGRQNEQQRFFFRGIDEVMNIVGPILWKHDVLFLINYEDYPDVDRVSGKGATLIYAKVKGEFTFISARDGSQVSVITIGVAMDSGDKATNKAMSAALKYALLQTFLIPTEADDDADATTPEATVKKAPDGFDAWFADVVAVAEEGFEAIKEAWRNSAEPFRNFAMEYRADEWDAAKKHALQITNDAKAAKRKAAKA